MSDMKTAFLYRAIGGVRPVVKTFVPQAEKDFAMCCLCKSLRKVAGKATKGNDGQGELETNPANGIPSNFCAECWGRHIDAIGANLSPISLPA